MQMAKMIGLQVLSLMFLSTGIHGKLAPLLDEGSVDAIDGEYVVVLKSGITAEQMDAHIENINTEAFVEQQTKLQEEEEARTLEAYGQTPGSDERMKRQIIPEAVMSRYSIETFKAYGARLSNTLRDKIRAMSEVKYVEKNKVVRVAACTNSQLNAPYGLVRITARNRPTGNIYNFSNTGAGVNVYVIDTGINLAHPDFEGRAIWGADFIDVISPRTDPEGHGTHVAGTIMSKTFGVAKKATAIAVRVLGADGFGSLTGILSGINFVRNQHKPGAKSVINMSIGGPKSLAENAAVNAAAAAGIYVVTAAGNEAADACTRSPASASGSITVMASDRLDVFAPFSNFGPCAHIIAPGVGILSTSNNIAQFSRVLSGTSMASPHVAGVIAKFIGGLPATSLPTPAAMKTILQSQATVGVIRNVPITPPTPNRLVFSPCA